MRGGSPTATLWSNIIIDADKSMEGRTLTNLNEIYTLGSFYFATNAREIVLPDTDNNFAMVLARDNGVGRVEVCRWQGAADPYFQATLPMVLKPAVIPAALVEGHFGYDSATDQLWWRDAAATRFLPRVASGTYTGNGADDRQIAVGFTCKTVFVQQVTLLDFWMCMDTARCLYFDLGVVSALSADVLLHATDGFVVDNVKANTNLTVYNYTAIG